MNKRDYKKDIDELYKDFGSANAINKSNLLKIVSDNKNTYFGIKYNFNDINSVDDYIKKVPLTTYADYSNGNEYVYEIGYHLSTSGTLGKQKKFTVSKLAMELYGGYNYEMPFYLLNLNTEKGFHVSVFRDPKKETLLSCALYDYLRNNNYYDSSDYYGYDFMFSDVRKNIPYIKMYIALAHKDIRHFDSIFLYDLLIVFKYLQNNWQMILKDIKNKTFSVDLKDSDKELLLKEEFTKERIEEIEKILNEGFNEPVIKKLFPDLKFVTGVGGGKYEIYDKDLKSFIGDTDIFYYIFAQTECTMGVPLKMNEARYAMMPRTCFYEYLDMETNMVVQQNELVKGKYYEPIVTTFSGLYRYHTGDTIEFIEYIKESPIVEIKGRINSIINIAGEKVDDADISLAMSRIKDKYVFNQFAVGIDTRVYPNRYILFLETDNIDDNIAIDFDKKLKEIALDYDDLRNLEEINPPIAMKISTKQFNSIQKGQIKPKVVLNDLQVKEWLNEQ